MAEFHNTKRVAIINKAGSGKSTLARYLIEKEINSSEGYWINAIWANGEIYSGDMVKGLVDVQYFNDNSIQLLSKEKADKVVLSKEGKKIWYPERYETSDRKGVRLIQVTTMKQLPVQEAERGKDITEMGIINLDEMFKCLPARRSGSEYNLVYGGLMANIRHIQCHFVGTDQVRRGVDNFIRANIDTLLVPIAPNKEGKEPLEYWVYDDFSDSDFTFLKYPPNPLEQALEKTVDYYGKPLSAINVWNMYTTIDIPPLLYDEPFGLKEYTTDVMTWRLPSGIYLGEKISEFTIRSPELRSYLMLYEQSSKKHITEAQRRALTAYLDDMGLLRKWEPKGSKK